MAAFAGQVVVVTGASEGIGRAFCLALALQRPRLVLAARIVERLRSLAEECRGLGAETLVVATDVTDESACRGMIEAAVTMFGGIDVLVNDAWLEDHDGGRMRGTHGPRDRATRTHVAYLRSRQAGAVSAVVAPGDARPDCGEGDQGEEAGRGQAPVTSPACGKGQPEVAH